MKPEILCKSYRILEERIRDNDLGNEFSFRNNFFLIIEQISLFCICF